MAKAKKAPVKREIAKKDVVEVNLDPFAVPIAIVIAGIIIALAIFLTNKSSKTEVDDKQPTPSAEGEAPEVPEGDVTVSIGDAPTLGDRNKAKIAIVEYSDFGCGYCKRHAEQVYPDLKSKYVDKGEVLYVFKSYPLSEAGTAYNAALAFHCVAKLTDSEKAATFHKNAFGFTSDADVKNGAIAVGVDGGKYDSCMADSAVKAAVAAERSEGSSAGISGTPGFVVGKIGDDGKVTGPLIKGAYPLTTFEAAISGLSK